MTRARTSVTRIARAVAVCTLVAGLGACLHTETSTIVENPPADSVVFWPASVKYARHGDTLHLLIHGLKRRRMCAIPQLGWNFLRDSTGHEAYELKAEFEIPRPGCRSDAAGLDTSFRVRFYTTPGKWLYLRTPDGRTTDSVLFVAADTPDAVHVITLRHVPGDADATEEATSGSAHVTRRGKAVYRDSTAAHPRRMVTIEALEACEILQAATYEPRGDTTLVKVRLIKATFPPAPFAPCSGPRTDSVEVVFNRYNFLP